MNEYLIERKYPFKTGFMYDFVQCSANNVGDAINKVINENNKSIVLSVYIGDSFGWEVVEEFEDSPYTDFLDCEEYYKSI